MLMPDQRRVEVGTHQAAAAAAATTFIGRIYPSVCTASITCRSSMLEIEAQEMSCAILG